MKRITVLFCFLFVGNFRSLAHDNRAIVIPLENILQSNELASPGLYDEDEESGRPNPLLQLLKKQQKKNKKAAAMIMAFPFPFGLVGLHRIYLGCAPYVPVAYIASLGGVFGILPLVDFIVLAASKNLDSFINNQHVFMWVD